MRLVLACVVLAMATASCAKRIPEPAAKPAVPYVSWIIMHGDSDNPDAQFACQSTGPRECTLPVSSPAAKVFSDVHMYFHGVGKETTYVGSYRAEFFNASNAAPRDSPIRTTVRGDEQIVNHSVTGIVTTTPGQYALRLNVDA